MGSIKRFNIEEVEQGGLFWIDPSDTFEIDVTKIFVGNTIVRTGSKATLTLAVVPANITASLRVGNIECVLGTLSLDISHCELMALAEVGLAYVVAQGEEELLAAHRRARRLIYSLAARITKVELTRSIGGQMLVNLSVLIDENDCWVYGYNPQIYPAPHVMA